MKFAYHVTLLLFAVSIMVIFVGLSFKRRTVEWLMNFKVTGKQTDETFGSVF